MDGYLIALITISSALMLVVSLTFTRILCNRSHISSVDFYFIFIFYIHTMNVNGVQKCQGKKKMDLTI